MTTPKNKDTDGNELTIDERFALLSSRYRRYMLYSLFYFTTPVPLARIADKVAEMEHEASAEEVPDERLDIYMELYHHHLPRLVEADVVEHDQTDDTIELEANASRLATTLKRSMREEFPDESAELFPKE